MTIAEITHALWDAGVTIRLDAKHQPILSGRVAPEVLAALKEHRKDIIEVMRGTQGARLEGLVCGQCCPDAVPQERLQMLASQRIRWCVEHHTAEHYPRK